MKPVTRADLITAMKEIKPKPREIFIAYNVIDCIYDCIGVYTSYEKAQKQVEGWTDWYRKIYGDQLPRHCYFEIVATELDVIGENYYRTM